MIKTIDKEKITWIEPYYDLVLNMIPLDVRNILDIGSGSGVFGFILKKCRQNTKITAIEPFNYDLSHYDNVITETYQKATINSYDYDCVIALEMIEHLDKPTALDFLAYCKRLSYRKVIVATPYQFNAQPEYDNNPYQKHLCSITINDFLKNKYRVYLVCNWTNKIINMRILARRQLLFILQRLEPLGLKITNIIGVYDF